MIVYKIKKWGFLFLVVIFFLGCNNEKKNYFSGMGLGSYYTITYIGLENKQLKYEIDSIINQFSKTVSIFDTTSMLTKVNANTPLVLNDDFIKIFTASKRISKMTKGAFDPTVAPLVTIWGFGNAKQQKVTQNEIDSIREFVGFEKVIIQNNSIQKSDSRIQLNFNAIAEGYIVDKLTEFMVQKGYKNFVLYVGGEVRTKGAKFGKDWQVGIQIPTETADGNEAVDYVFALKNKAVSTSGNYRRYHVENGQRLSHIINPRTGKSEKNNLLSVTVLADKCIDADALATSFMVMGLNEAMAFLKVHPEYAAYFIYSENGKMMHQKTANFPEKIE